MASGNLQQYEQAKTVIKESHKPDTTFSDQDGIHTEACFSQMPIECIIMEIRSSLWDTQYIVEYAHFKAHYFGDVPYPEGMANRVEEMLDDACARMPQWLFWKCLDIYKVFFVECKIAETQVRSKRGPCPYRQKVIV